MKRKLSLGLVLALVLVLLAAVALAIGLSYSPRCSAVQAARQALMQKYGLTQEMLRLYDERDTVKDGITTVLFVTNDSEFFTGRCHGRVYGNCERDRAMPW